MKKNVFLLLVTAGFCLLPTGCAEFSKSFKAQEQHLASVDQKITELEQSLANMDTSTQNYGKRIEELSQKAADTDTNYLKLQNAFDGFSSKEALRDNSLETVLAETQKSIKDIEKKIAEIEKSKADLQNQLLNLQTQKSRITGSRIEQHSEAMKEDAKEMFDEGRQMIKEATAEKKSEEDKKAEATVANNEKETLQKLLDDALTLYREGDYKGAIGKWDEVLIIDPGNLEAKFNIEIAKEKIKTLPEK